MLLTAAASPGVIAVNKAEVQAAAKLRETQAKAAATRFVKSAQATVNALVGESTSGQAFADKLYEKIQADLRATDHPGIPDARKDETAGSYLMTQTNAFNAFISQANTILNGEQSNVEKVKAVKDLWFTKENNDANLNEPFTATEQAIGITGLDGLKQFNATYKQFVASNFLPFLKAIDADCLTDKKREKRLAAQKPQ